MDVNRAFAPQITPPALTNPKNYLPEEVPFLKRWCIRWRKVPLLNAWYIFSDDFTITLVPTKEPSGWELCFHLDSIKTVMDYIVQNGYYRVPKGKCYPLDPTFPHLYLQCERLEYQAAKFHFIPDTVVPTPPLPPTPPKPNGNTAFIVPGVTDPSVVKII